MRRREKGVKKRTKTQKEKIDSKIWRGGEDRKKGERKKEQRHKKRKIDSKILGEKKG